LIRVNGNMKSRIRYDTIEESLKWTRKLSIQLNLAHVARKNIKKKLKQTNASAPTIHNKLIALSVRAVVCFSRLV